MKIYFISGKGGVGKSVLSAGLAKQLARQGRRVLLVELGEKSYFASLFGRGAIGHEPAPLEGSLSLSLWSGRSCFAEYARHLLKVESLYRLIFENPVSASLVDAAPGLAELAILGKITSGPPRNVGPELNFDDIVVDAYSSGHFLALIKAPGAFSEIISRGPMAEQSRGIVQVLSDPEITQFLIISQADEMMVTEAIELCESLRNAIQCRPKIILNRFIERPPGPSPEDGFGRAMRDYFARQEDAERRLSSIGPVTRVECHWVTDPRVVAERVRYPEEWLLP